MTKTTRCTASVWPHRHTDELTGPLDLKISYWNQPPFVQIVQKWTKKTKVRMQIEQPDERTNLTILRIGFNYLGRTVRDEMFSIKPYRLPRDKSLKFYIRSRITNQMKHPIPRGQWEGTYTYNEDYLPPWCLFTFQAMTAKVVQKKPLIVVPGEEGFVLP